MSIVIGISGWKSSGKDTMADYLVNDYGYTRVAFADVLKEMVATQYNIPLNSCHETALKEEPLIQFPVESKDGFGSLIHDFMVKEFRTKSGKAPQELAVTDTGTLGMIVNSDGTYGHWEEVFWTPRALCILEGSVKRSINSSYWVQRVIDKVNDMTELDPRAKFVISDMRYQSEVSQLEDAWPDTLATCRVSRFSSSPSSDPSERDLDGYPLDYIIDNVDTLSELYQNVDDMVAVAEGSIL
ncbi:MAG: hypothetical protein DRN30_04150 [Thermoplasmata archaeon]|nr:MAG: hypothetical protein DRN30_04150 [Thermoplasmata archaeon]